MDKHVKRIRDTIAAIALSLGLIGAVPAAAITIDGITFEAGATFIISTIFESKTGGGFVTTAGDEISGVGFVDSVQSPQGNVVWQNGDNGKELTLFFEKFKAERIIPIGAPAPILIPFSGGEVTFYSQAFGTFDSTLGTIPLVEATARAGTEWLNLVGSATGVACGDGTFLGGAAGACASPDGTPFTLQSTINGGTLLAITSGVGSGLLDVDILGAGSANGNFDNDAGPPTGIGSHDFSFATTFSNQGGSATPYPVDGTISFDTITIPEPGMAALFGLGLIALGAVGRRRMMKAAA